MRETDPPSGKPEQDRESFVLRAHRPGDMGWIVQMHGELYVAGYGWDAGFEAVVARIVAEFLERLDPERERCWIAERNGERIGSIALVQHPERAGVAKLRLLIVHPQARGLGVGRRLVQECVRFARQAGYEAIELWTYDVLASATRIYAAEGFLLVREERVTAFGKNMTDQTWELELV